MMRPALLALLALTAPALASTAPAETPPAAMTLPSGQAVTLHQVIWPEAQAAGGERRLRLRFVAPQIAAGAKTLIAPEAASDDLQYLCDHVALPALKKDGRAVDEIVITMMAKPLPFGTADPKVRQYIDTFLPKEDHCEWEGL
ncbi:DUF6497 family protein [Acidimangrovimonas sediminis]|uniref:DUF6497 family protein n=1 Tax=Acidimangrovimonas sediminis TaxID=2056283 RepID=UPI000C7F7DD1|nr:DUF6497 family protein [Acidimangrovimonas sediminis]